MPRAIWTGTISFGLVNVPVKLYSATQSQQVSFHQFEPESGERIRYQRVTERSGKEVDYDDIAKGYEVSKGDYVLLTQEELESVEDAASRMIEIEDFIDLDAVDPIYFDKTYHLAPTDEAAAKAYALLKTAMEESNRVAVARFVMRSKQHLAAIRASDDVLVLETMFFADEVRPAADIPELEQLEGVKVTQRETEMAQRLIDSLTSEWEPEQYRDTYRERVLELIERKAQGERIVTDRPDEKPAQVVDLMAALEASVASARQEGGGKRAAGADRTASNGDGASGDGDREDRSKEELYAEAQRKDIPGRSSMSKDELVDALRKAS